MSLGRLVLVPLTNPASVDGLMDLAAQLADADGIVVPVTVLRPAADDVLHREARALVRSAEEAAAEYGAVAHGAVVTHESVAGGVLEAAEEQAASLVLMGWRGRSTQRNVFGELIDTVVGRSRMPLAVVRLGARRGERVLLPVSGDHLVPTGAGGVRLAVDLSQRLGPRSGRTVRLLRTGDESDELPDDVHALSDRVHHDPRRYPVAVGAAADASDVVVVPVAPTVGGLRTATTHVAWSAPDSTLVVAIDVGPPAGDVEEATASAGQPAPESGDENGDERVFTVLVFARHAAATTRTREELGSALRPLGTVGEVEALEDDDGHRCVRTRVRVPARESNQALAIVMTALHEADCFTGAELRYELEDDPADEGHPAAG